MTDDGKHYQLRGDQPGAHPETEISTRTVLRKTPEESDRYIRLLIYSGVSDILGRNNDHFLTVYTPEQGCLPSSGTSYLGDWAGFMDIPDILDIPGCNTHGGGDYHLSARLVLTLGDYRLFLIFLSGNYTPEREFQQ